MILIISCSLNSDSRSEEMAEFAKDSFSLPVHFLNLKKLTLPLASEVTHNQDTSDFKKACKLVTEAQAILFCSPIYNWDVSAATKNFIEQIGTPEPGEDIKSPFKEKIIGFLGSAHSERGYLAPLGFLNSLMIDFQCWIVPFIVVASKKDVVDGVSEALQKRIKRHVMQIEKIVQAFEHKSKKS